MQKILITFASITGNTEIVASDLNHKIKEKYPDKSVDLINMEELDPYKLKEYDLVIMGSSTWFDGELNLISDEFFQRLESNPPDLSNTKFAVYALGEKGYPNFATSAEVKEEKLKLFGGNIIAEAFKLDIQEEAYLDHAWEWAQKILA